MKKRVVFFAFLLMTLFSTGVIVTHSTEAAIYDNGGPDFLGFLGSDFVLPQEAGDDFVLNAGANFITDIHWWGLYDTPVPLFDDFSIRIFDFTSGVPAANPFYTNNVGAVTRLDTGQALTGTSFEVFEYSVDVSPISLSPGTPYLLSIVNNTGQPDSWLWQTSQTSGGDAFVRFNPGTQWTSIAPLFPFELAFNLTGPSSVPEPSTFLLFGAGLAGVGILRRKFKK